MKKIIIPIGILLMMGTVHAQQPGASTTDPSRFQPNIFPPSPEAFKLGSYGNTPVGMFTGTPNIDVPIMGFTAGNINVPIQINYSSNGIKVDELSGKAGLGWKFIAGGVITRVIRAIPDEDGQNPGHFVNPPDLDSLNIEDGKVREFLQNATSGGVDSEPDMYYANFGGVSLSFVFDKWGKPRILSLKNAVIEGTSGGSSFTIILENGVKYLFDQKETTTNRVFGGGHSIPSINVTAWYLSKITDTNGLEVNLEYEADETNGISAKSQTMSFTIPGASYSVKDSNGNCMNGVAVSPYIPPAVSHMQAINGKRLTRIYSNRPMFGEIQLTYQKLFDDDAAQINEVKKTINSVVIESYSFSFIKTPSLDRAYLEKIVDNKSGKKYLFEYITPSLIPQRLSYSRDKWGYFNGKANTNLIPALPDVSLIKEVSYPGADQEVDIVKTQAGLLAKIIYPTGGFTMIKYEPNTIKDTRIYKSPKTAKQLKVWSTSDQGSTDKPTDTVTFYNEMAQNMYVSLRGDFNSNDCDSAEDTGFHHKATISGTKENGQSLFAPPGGLCPGWPNPSPGTQVGTTVRGNSVTCFSVPQGMVTFNLHVAFRCTTGSSFINYALPDIIKIENVPVGGSRVAQTITTYENASSTPITISYKYDAADNFSTGVLVRPPYFIDFTTSGELCIGSNYDFPLVHLSSDNVRSLNATHPNLFYEQVTEYRNGGSIVHEYSTSTDIYGNIRGGADIVSSPWTNRGWLNGKELTTTYYDSTNTPLKKVENNFVEDVKKRSTIIGLSLRKNYELTYIQAPVRKCSIHDVNIKYSDYECTTNHQHTWYDGKCINAGASNILRTTYDECYGKPTGTEFIHNNIVGNISIVQYKNISRFDYLQSQKTTDFLNGTAVKTETQYFYDNPQHYQSTGQLTIGSDNSRQLTGYTYAHEENNTNMLAANMVGIPLQTETKENGKFISKVKTIYGKNAQTNNFVLPVSVQKYDQDNSSAAKTIIKYDQYDANGNLLQYTTKGGIPTSIIWGYNSTLPIARIEGATYQEAFSLAADIIAKSNEDVDAAREQALMISQDTFRESFATKKYRVTTYTYDPLIGVTGIIPPTGIREYYKYDSSNRLQSIVDVNNNILKEFNYNYKH